MIRSGAGPTRADHRDFSLKRTFGTVMYVFADNLNVDAGFGFPDQNAEGLPYGCTGETTKELAQDEDLIRYRADYTYDKTRKMEGTYPEQVGCDVRDSLKTAALFGVLAENEEYDESADTKAAKHRHGAYFNVIDPWNQHDAFNDVRSAIANFELEKRSVSVGTPWFSEWSYAPDGVLTTPTIPLALRSGIFGFIARIFGNFGSGYSWHNWKICGWKQINGQPYLIGKSWQGAWYGDGGYHYISRELFNKIMAIPGTAAFTLAPRPKDVKEIKKIQIDAISWVLSLCVMWLEQIRIKASKLAPV